MDPFHLNILFVGEFEMTEEDLKEFKDDPIVKNLLEELKQVELDLKIEEDNLKLELTREENDNIRAKFLFSGLYDNRYYEMTREEREIENIEREILAISDSLIQPKTIIKKNLYEDLDVFYEEKGNLKNKKRKERSNSNAILSEKEREAPSTPTPKDPKQRILQSERKTSFSDSKDKDKKDFYERSKSARGTPNLFRVATLNLEETKKKNSNLKSIDEEIDCMRAFDYLTKKEYSGVSMKSKTKREINWDSEKITQTQIFH